MTNKRAKRDFSFGLNALVVLSFALFITSNVSATGEKIYFCMSEGQTIRYSECNPLIEDYTCEADLCQRCVTEINGAYCPADGCTAACIPYVEPEDNFPVITLKAPSELFFSENATSINFKFRATKPSMVDVCKLFLNDVNVTQTTTRVQPSDVILPYFVQKGSYKWQIKCTTRESDHISESEIRSLTVGYNETGDPAKISLTTPENNFVSAGTQDVLFSFSFGASINLGSLSSCNLNLNNAPTAINIPEITNRAYSLTKSVTPGSYSWNVACSSATNNYTSDTRSFTINEPPPAGGGGGGGSPRRTPVNSTNTTATNFTELGGTDGQGGINITDDEANSVDNDKNANAEENNDQQAPARGFMGILGDHKILVTIIAIALLTVVGLIVVRANKYRW